MSEWQPIETAPKDGSPILTFSGERCGCCPPKTAGIGHAYWDEGGFWSSGRIPGGKLALKHRPTHWMPLPSPPHDGEQS